MKITKSTRHAKIAGTFGEQVLLYWLSKHGFECATVDHTGIDLIARNPHSAEVMGISVKSRTRTLDTEADPISIPNDQFDKVQTACDAFGCVPYFALVADTKDVIRIFVISMAHLLELYRRGKSVCSWKMSEQALSQYYADPEIKVFELHTKTHSWWSETPNDAVQRTAPHITVAVISSPDTPASNQMHS
jgi:Holliday junction resolvase